MTLRVPIPLAEWTYGVVLELLMANVHEDRTFDWKEMLPPSKDTGGKARFVRGAAALANNGGGFLIIGVKDDAGLPPTAGASKENR